MKKQITKKHPKGFIRIYISTDGCGGNPYFSITAELCEDSTFRDSKIHACGCLHDRILAACPELKPFVDLHLSDINGVPVHAVENGFYWLCKAACIPQDYAPEQSPEKCTEYLQNHLRTGYAETLFIMGEVVTAYMDGKDELFFDETTPETRDKQEKQGIFRAKNKFEKIVDSLRPIWQKQAAEAIKQLEEMP